MWHGSWSSWDGCYMCLSLARVAAMLHVASALAAWNLHLLKQVLHVAQSQSCMDRHHVWHSPAEAAMTCSIAAALKRLCHTPVPHPYSKWWLIIDWRYIHSETLVYLFHLFILNCSQPCAKDFNLNHYHVLQQIIQAFTILFYLLYITLNCVVLTLNHKGKWNNNKDIINHYIMLKSIRWNCEVLNTVSISSMLLLTATSLFSQKQDYP